MNETMSHCYIFRFSLIFILFPANYQRSKQHREYEFEEFLTRITKVTHEKILMSKNWCSSIFHEPKNFGPESLHFEDFVNSAGSNNDITVIVILNHLHEWAYQLKDY